MTESLQEAAEELDPIDNLYDANQRLHAEVERLRAENDRLRLENPTLCGQCGAFLSRLDAQAAGAEPDGY